MRRPLALLLPGLLGLLLVFLALQREGPLFVNLGAGDEAFARGFRGDWERDGLQHTGDTQFHWTQDGSRLELPVTVSEGALTARIRLARFTASPVEVSVLAGGRTVDAWRQVPRGWTVRELPLGTPAGPLTLQFRSSDDPDGLGLALDWVEVNGARRVWPTAPLVLRLVLLCVLLPALLAARATRPLRAAALWAGGVALVGVTAVLLDRLGGLSALGTAALPLLGIAAVLAALPLVEGSLRTVPAAFALVALVALSHPFFYYPDVDTHARYLALARRQPRLFLDPSPYQMRTGAWTRQIAGRQVAFPYSTVFHVAAWPLTPALGEVGAIKALAVGALTATLVLAGLLALGGGLGPAGAALAQALLALLPVVSSRLSLALYPALLGQALELGVLVLLARRFTDLDTAGGRLRLGLLLGVALLAYTGALITLSATVAVVALWAALQGERRRAAWLLGLHALAALLVLAVFYARFLPVLLREVLPHAGEGGVGEAGPVGLVRLHTFYDTLWPLLAVAGGVLWRGEGAVRRALAAAALAGAALLVGRDLVPVLLRDAKEVELLAAPVAVLGTAALVSLGRRGRAGLLLAALLALGLAGWGAQRAAENYAARFFVVGR